MYTINFIQVSLVFLLMLFSSSCTSTKNASTNAISTEKKPNIVFILCDDLGYGDIQSLAPATSKIKTPHVDKLTQEGMVFTDAHSGSSVCTEIYRSVVCAIICDQLGRGGALWSVYSAWTFSNGCAAFVRASRVWADIAACKWKRAPPRLAELLHIRDHRNCRKYFSDWNWTIWILF